MRRRTVAAIILVPLDRAQTLGPMRYQKLMSLSGLCVDRRDYHWISMCAPLDQRTSATRVSINGWTSDTHVTVGGGDSGLKATKNSPETGPDMRSEEIVAVPLPLTVASPQKSGEMLNAEMVNRSVSPL